MRAGTWRFGWPLVVLMPALAGCGGKAYVRSGFLEHPPKRVAVLPFVITYPYDTPGQVPPKEHQLGRDMFRKTFYYALTPFGYEDVKLANVDQTLTAAFGPIQEGGWQKATPQALGQAIGADALVYGEVSHIMHFSTPLYTETSLEATLRMVDARSGEALWRKRVQVADRGGALVQKGQVVDFFEDQWRSFNPAVKFLRVSEAAARRLLRDFPNPPMSNEAIGESSPAAVAGSGARLAVLPFRSKNGRWQPAEAQLRRYLVAHLQDGPFQVIEDGRVDDALRTVGWESGKPMPETFSLPDVAKTMGADALLDCTVTDWGRTYALIESWVKTGVEARLIDAASGQVIWSEKKRNTHQSGILKGPTGYTSIATAPIMGMKTSNLERVAEELMSRLAHDLVEAPSVKAYVSEKKP